MFKKRIVVLLLVVSVFPGLSKAVPTNGDFSMLDAYGDPTLDPWTVSGTVSNGGGRALFEENTDNDRISSLAQTFVIPDGAKNLSFDYQMSSQGGGLPSSDTFSAYLGGVEIFSINNDSLAPDGGTISGTFSKDVSLLAGQNLELSFQLLSYDDGFNTTVTLDNVDVSTVAVPAPGAVLLGGIGVASIGWLRRRRMM